MAGGVENLRPVQSKDEAKARGHNGGIASGAARRKKRDMKARLAAALECAPNGKQAEALKAFGIDPTDADMLDVVCVELVKKAAAGGVMAAQTLATLSGHDPYVKIKEAEIRLKRAELKEKQRQFDVTREDRQAAADVPDVSEAWIQAVIAAENPRERDDAEEADK